MNTQTLKMILHGKLAETEALLETTPYELYPDDSKILLGRRSTVVELLGFAQTLSEQQGKGEGEGQENPVAQEEGQNTQSFQCN
jgi:hypothetical protein